MKIEKQYDSGLVLLKAIDGTLIWRFKYIHRMNRRSVFLGKLPDVSENKAISKADLCKELLRNGKDPKFNRDFFDK